MGNKSYQLTSAGRSANPGQTGRHWLAGNSYFPRWKIFIFSFLEPLVGLHIGYEGLEHCTRLFIQICFVVVCNINFKSKTVWELEEIDADYR